jgi:hypothetical protein
MSTPVALLFIVLLADAGLSLWYVPAFRRAREPRIVICPEAKERAVVRPKAWLFAATSLKRLPTLRLADCTRWPEAAGCDQACAPRVAKKVARTS